jgi:8-oxo-dGTP pyrophosphatase MutT (NUDIX family)
MAGQDGAPGPEEPPRPKGRRRRRRRAPRAKEPSNGSTGRPAAAGAAQPGRKTHAAGREKPAAAKAGAAKKQGAKKDRAKKKRAKPATKRPSGPRLPTQREVSAGGVVYRRAEDAIEVVLASRRTRRGDLAWGLAKGGIEPGESREDAAIREVREETGLDATIEADLGDTRYIYVWEDVRIRKRVHFFLMRHTGGDVDDRDDEMEEVRWFPLERALKRAAYRGERDVLARAAELLR